MAIVSDKSNFDVQLQFGDINQQQLVDVFGSGVDTLEVKSERANNWSKSGNICIEYAYDRWDADKKERVQAKSGLATSKAEHWAQMLMLEDGSYGAMLIFPTEFLRGVMRKLWDTAKKIEVSRDSAADMVTRGKAYCILLPVAEVFLELQKVGGYYKGGGQTNGFKAQTRIPDAIIPFDVNGTEPPV